MTKQMNLSKFKELEKLDTAALEKIIHADFHEAEECDNEKIEYVLMLLARRKQEEGDELPDINAAWRNFRSKLNADIGLAASINTERKNKRRIMSGLCTAMRRLVSAAACIACCFSVFLAAPPEPRNTSDLNALWGNGAFRFVSEEEYLANYMEDHEPPLHFFAENVNKEEYSQIDPRLEELFAKAESVNLPTVLLPRWFPENCHVLGMECGRLKPYTSASAGFEWDEESMYTLSCGLMKYDYPVNTKYFTTLKGIHPELYTSGQFTFFVVQYEGMWSAVWMSFPYEITICGIDTKENLLKVIDSIQGGIYE